MSIVLSFFQTMEKKNSQKNIILGDTYETATYKTIRN